MGWRARREWLPVDQSLSNRPCAIAGRAPSFLYTLGRLGQIVKTDAAKATEVVLKINKLEGVIFSHILYMNWLQHELTDLEVLTRERVEELRPLYEKSQESAVKIWLGELRNLRSILDFREGEKGVSFKDWCDSNAVCLPCSIPDLVLPVWNDDKAQELAKKYAFGLFCEKDDDGVQKVLTTPKAKELAECYLLEYMFFLFLAYNYLRGCVPAYEEGGKVEEFDPVAPLNCIAQTACTRGWLLGSMGKLDKPVKLSLTQDSRKMLIVAEAITESPKATDSTIKMKIAAKSVAVTLNHEAISGTQQGQWLKAFRSLPEKKQRAYIEQAKQNLLKQK